MAHLVVDFYSDALGMETRMHALLPECLTEGKAKTLYLLHGMSDNEGTVVVPSAYSEGFTIDPNKAAAPKTQ